MKRVEIYLGPIIRNRREEATSFIRRAMREANVEGSLVVGSSESVFDYAVEGLDRDQAYKLTQLIKEEEGYSAKFRDRLS